MITDISRSSKEQLFDLIVYKNPDTTETLSVSQLQFETPTLHQGGGYDVVVKAKTDSGFNGQVAVNYDKINLGDFSILGVDNIIDFSDVPNFNGVVNAVNAHYGSNLDGVLDIDPASQTIPTPTMEGTSYTLTAHPNSLAYKGYIGLLLRNINIALAQAIPNTNLTGFTYGVTGIPSYVVGAQYCYSFDLTLYSNILAATTVGTVISAGANPLSTNILSFLAYADQDGSYKALWKLNTGTSGNNLLWNVHGATVIYNGLNNDLNRPRNADCKYVLELQLRNDIIEPLGKIYFYYNLLIDPTNVNDPNDA